MQTHPQINLPPESGTQIAMLRVHRRKYTFCWLFAKNDLIEERGKRRKKLSFLTAEVQNHAAKLNKKKNKTRQQPIVKVRGKETLDNKSKTVSSSDAAAVIKRKSRSASLYAVCATQLPPPELHFVPDLYLSKCIFQTRCTQIQVVKLSLLVRLLVPLII